MFSALHNKIYGPNWTEYNLVRSARPWFSGHAQPRGPLLGELDESKPETWEKYNELCKQSGIDVALFGTGIGIITSPVCMRLWRMAF